MQDENDDTLEAQGQRRAELLVAKLVETLRPTSRQMENYYPPINPKLYSAHDGDVARRRILERDNYTCAYCGASIATSPSIAFHVDHIVPLSKGGSDAIGNLVTACEHCNTSKGDRRLSIVEERRILDDVMKRNAAESINPNEHLHVLGAARRARIGGKRK